MASWRMMWLLAYWLASTATYAQVTQPTKNVAVNVKVSDVSVECLPTGMRVSISKCKLPGLQSLRDVHFLDLLCHAKDNGTHFVVFTSIMQRNRCKTKSDYNSNGILYSNTLMTRRPNSVQVAGLCPLLKVKFSCLYPYFSLPFSRAVRSVEKELECEHVIGIGPAIDQGIHGTASVRSAPLRQVARVLTCPLLIGIGPAIKDGVFGRDQSTSNGGFRARTKTLICKPLKSSGSFDIKMKAYTDKEYRQAIGKLLVTDHEFIDIFYEIKLTTSDEHLVISPTKCFATPSKDPEDKTQYVFISESCAKDRTVRFYNAPSKSSRFSIQSFKFTNQPSNLFYVHCEIAICDVNDTESLCAEGCAANSVGRMRRDFSDHMNTKIRLNGMAGIKETCQMNKIKIEIAKYMLPGVQAKHLHLNEKDCIAGENQTHFLFNFNTYQCGTIRSDGTRRVSFRNMIYLKVEDSFQVGLSFASPIVCYFTKEQAHSSSFIYRPKKPKRYLAIAKSGLYKVQFKILADAKIAQIYKKSPLDIGLREYKGTLGVMVAAMDDNIIFSTKHCAIKPSLVSIRKQILIAKGCPAHKSVLYYTSSGQREFMRIDFNEWYSPNRLMHLTCSVMVCDKNNPTEDCKKSCKTTTPPSRRRRSTGLDINTSITCGSNSMTIAIEKASAPSLKPQDIHLQDESCIAVDNSTHLILSTSLQKCGTKIKSNGILIEYSNIVLQKLNSPIRRNNFIEMPVKCMYAASSSVRSKGIKANEGLIRFSGTATGTYEVRINMFDDNTFRKQSDTSLASVAADDDMYFEVAFDKTNLNVAIYLEKCSGKPTFANSERDEYIFIQDNCSQDSSVRFYDSGRLDTKRFSVKPFEFANIQVKSILITCVVSACDPNDLDSSCFKRCPRRLF